MVAGFASAALPVKVIIPVVLGIALFVLIYQNFQVGIILYLIFNLLLPQAGPTIDLGIKTPVGERGLHFNIHEIIIAMVLLAWLIQLFLKKAEWRTSSPLLWAVGFYVLMSILACLIGLVNGGRPLVVAFRFFRTTFFAYIFFLVLNTVKTRRQLKQIVVVTLVCATIIAGFGLVQWVLGESWAAEFNQKVLDRIGYPENINFVAGESEGQTYRVNSTFAHPNVLGAYLVFFLPFFISLLWYYTSFMGRALLLSALAINLTCLFLTGSRASWIAAAAIALCYAVFGLLDRRLVLTIAVVALLIIGMVVLISPPEYVKIRLQGYQAQRATQLRIYQYQIAADLFLQRPLFGLGEGMIGYQIKMGNIREIWLAVENIYLAYLVSHGLVGLFAFMLVWFFFWGMLLSVRRRCPQDPFLKYTSEALILGMVGYAVASVFGAWLLFAIAMFTLWWFYIGVGACVYNLSREPSANAAFEPSGPGPALRLPGKPAMP